MKHNAVLFLFMLLFFSLLLSGCGMIFSSLPTAAPELTLTPESAPEPTPTPEPTPDPTPTYDLNFTVGDQQLSESITELDLAQASTEEVDRLISVLPALTALKTLELGYADAQNPNISWEQLHAIEEASPDLTINYSFLLYGYRFNLDYEILNISHAHVPDEGALTLKVAQCMPYLRILDMDSCGVSNESMAAIRDALPEVNVVWRVFFGDSYSVRTDAIRILMSNPERGENLNDANIKGLYYCNKVKYLDIGHMSGVRDSGYLANMPDLEVLIIAMTAIKDISPIVNCPKLNYLEYQTSSACDLSPLSGLTNLRDLNICYDFALRDIRPLYNLDLDRLWIGCLTPIPKAQIEEYRSLHPNCIINTTTENPTEEEWRTLKDYYPPQPAPRYEQLYEEFQYATFPLCYAYNENDMLYWRHAEYTPDGYPY